MKSRNKLFAAFAAVSVLASAGIASAEKLNFYTTQTSTTLPQVQGIQKIADEVGEATSGELDVSVLIAGTLQISAADTTNAVASNVIQMADDFVFSGSVPIGAVLRLPLVVGDVANKDATMNASFEAVKEAYAAKGVTLLAGYMMSPQYIWSTKEVRSLDDLRGEKLRVSSPEQAEFIKAIGGVPIVLPPSEVTAALERGVVTGNVTSPLGGEFFGGPLKSGLLVPVNFTHSYLIINTSVFESLTPEQQKILSDSAVENARWIQNEMVRQDDASVQKFRERPNFTVVEPSEADMARSAEVAEPIWKAWVEQHGADGKAIFDAVRAAVEN